MSTTAFNFKFLPGSPGNRSIYGMKQVRTGRSVYETLNAWCVWSIPSLHPDRGGVPPLQKLRMPLVGAKPGLSKLPFPLFLNQEQVRPLQLCMLRLLTGFVRPTYSFCLPHSSNFVFPQNFFDYKHYSGMCHIIRIGYYCTCDSDTLCFNLLTCTDTLCFNQPIDGFFNAQSTVKVISGRSKLHQNMKSKNQSHYLFNLLTCGQSSSEGSPPLSLSSRLPVFPEW